MEYIIAKAASLCAVELAVAALLASSVKWEHLPYTLLGTALSGMLFTLLGIILATKITSLNQFILWTVPVEVMGSVPAILHLFGVSPIVLDFYPTSICIDIMMGKECSAIGYGIVIAVVIGLFAIARKCVLKMWKSAGGIKL